MSTYSIQQPKNANQSMGNNVSLIPGKWNTHQHRNENILHPTPIQVESLQDRFIKKIMACIEKDMGNPQLCVTKLALEMCMSNIQLYRKLKSITGHTPNELIRDIRLQRAASLLIQHADRVSAIAYQVGFNNLSYFSKCFREKYGLTPSEFMHQKRVFPITYNLQLPNPIQHT